MQVVGDEACRRPVLACPRPATTRTVPGLRIFTPAVKLPLHGHPDARRSTASSAGRSRRSSSGWRPGPDRPGVSILEREGRKIVLGGIDRSTTWETVQEPAPDPGRARRGALGTANRRSTCGPGTPLYRARLPGSRPGTAPGHQALGHGHSGRGQAVAPHVEESLEARMFAPNHGVNEDPATGSAAGPLMPACRYGRIPLLGESRSRSARRRVDRPSTLFATVRRRRRPHRSGRGRRLRGATIARGEFGF